MGMLAEPPPHSDVLPGIGSMEPIWAEEAAAGIGTVACDQAPPLLRWSR
jgi:hypothetical protein